MRLSLGNAEAVVKVPDEPKAVEQENPNTVKPIYELVYADRECREKLRKQYLQATIKDASDDIHPDRFEIEFEGTRQDKLDFYLFMAKIGSLGACFGIQLMMGVSAKDDKEGHQFLVDLNDALGKLWKEQET